jgi:asparagine synthase (glutamine-hydrolysing)
LAIIDLSKAGQQPMQDTTNDFTIVFNGEIYNHLELKQELIDKGHSFFSHSDTEVILAAYSEWGKDCLLHLNGMFAFALYDSRKRFIFLARDRTGEKPLFYSLSNGIFRFASELKGLLIDPNFSHQINHQALDAYLTLGYVPGNLCIVQGANKLPAAHAMIFDLNKQSLQTWKYWQLPSSPALTEITQSYEEALLEDFELLLEDAVQKQLSADVPVGILLSGGVDSSLITAMAVRSSNQVKTFTVRFDGYNKYDESKHARLIADYFGTEHFELNAGDASPELLKTLARQYDEPMADSSMFSTYLVSRLVRNHCTVALGGDGGDELFGGYQHYDRLLWRQHKVDWLPLILRKIIAQCGESLLPIGFKGRNWLQSLSCDLNVELPLIASFFDSKTRLNLMGNKSWPLVGESIWRAGTPKNDDLLQRLTRMDFNNFMVEDILVKIDRASMLNSLELRAPLLDHRILEFAFGRVPSSLKTTFTSRKIFLKKLAKKLLPPNFDRQRKQGFGVPLEEWLKKGPWRDLFHDVLLDSQSIFDKKTVKKLLQGQDRGRRNSERLLCLVLFELWRREYKMTL